MKIIVKVKPASKKDLVEKVDEVNYVVSVKAPPVDGKANASVVTLLAEHFDVSPSLVEIRSGYMAKIKIIEIHI